MTTCRNSGLFIWIDLRHLILPSSSDNRLDFDKLAASSPDSKIHEAREAEIAELCLKNGVMVAPGHVYMSEEYGWFRVTFTLTKEALQAGLQRLWKSIQEIETKRQDWT